MRVYIHMYVLSLVERLVCTYGRALYDGYDISCNPQLNEGS